MTFFGSIDRPKEPAGLNSGYRAWRRHEMPIRNSASQDSHTRSPNVSRSNFLPRSATADSPED